MLLIKNETSLNVFPRLRYSSLIFSALHSVLTRREKRKIRQNLILLIPYGLLGSSLLLSPLHFYIKNTIFQTYEDLGNRVADARLFAKTGWT
jgi:hypothetical protein